MSKTEETQEVAAAKSGMDAKTARKYLRSGEMPSQRKRDREWRTRPDPFAEVWDEIRSEKEFNPGLEAKTLFEEMNGIELFHLHFAFEIQLLGSEA